MQLPFFFCVCERATFTQTYPFKTTLIYIYYTGSDAAQK